LGPEYEEILFEHLRWQEAELPSDAKFFAAALFGLSQDHEKSAAQDYVRAVARVLEAQHWRVEPLRGASPTPLPRLRIWYTDEAIELRLSGREKLARPELFDLRDLSPVQLEHLPIVVTETADTATVVSRLVNFRELNVSIRDLVQLNAHVSTFWSLIANLTKRLGRSGELAQRGQFLAILTFQALRASKEKGEGADRLEQRLMKADFKHLTRLQIDEMHWLDGQATLELSLTSAGGHSRISYRMFVGHTGPEIAGIAVS
jgi:hypothetical protein